MLTIYVSLHVKLIALIALALFTLPVSAQPTSGPHAPDPPSETYDAASVALDASLDAVTHYGTAVMLWDALPSADGYIVEAGAPGAPLVEVARLASDAVSEGVGYSVRLDLPDGQYRVRIVAMGVQAATSFRHVTVASPDAFDMEDGPVVLLASN